MAIFRLRVIEGQSMEAPDLTSEQLNALLDELQEYFGPLSVDIEVMG